MSATPLAFALWRQLARRPAGPLAALAGWAGQPVDALCTALDGLAAAGVPVMHSAGLYWCEAPVEPLDIAQDAACVDVVEVHPLLPSTQDRALALLRAGGQSRVLVAAETQSAGRGRSGTAWLSPLGAHLTFTLGWRFRGIAAAQLVSLPVRLGLVLARVLEQHGVPVRLKWPNDLWLHGRKLGGILVEAHPAGAETLICAGFGLNHRMPPSTVLPWPEQPWIDLVAAAPAAGSRSLWLQRLLPALCAELAATQAAQGGDWQADFSRYDALAGQSVSFQHGERLICGEAAGVGHDGRLRVQVAGGEHQVGAGAVQLLRPAQRDVPWQLLLDCGNTRLKWAWSTLDGRALLAGGAVLLRDQTGVQRSPAQLAAELRAAIALLHQQRPPAALWLCSSHGGDRAALRKALADVFDCAVADLHTPDRLGPWCSAYRDPRRLGLDRALAMRGALDLPALPERTLLVSVGSALTLDLLQSDGRHLGGLIAASPTLSMQALHSLSPRLDPRGAHYAALAVDSPDAVLSACLQSAAALVERVVRQHGAQRVLWSGGGAGPVQAIVELPGVPGERSDALVLRGLAHWQQEAESGP